uniref:NADH dehydrogenase subunit 2 n=1 Tax=Euryhaliotrema johni TaxID=2849187 RepID=A0A8F2PQN7_9PLAT|nr:NADH dehydrogenase subunit 2 [Euryhaliotrema johni]
MLNILLLLSGFLYCFSLSWGSSLGFWLAMEAAGLIIVAGFFNYGLTINRYKGLLYYLLVSGTSASLIFSGFLSPFLAGFVVIGFIMKAGLTPFSSWVLVVYNNCGWTLLFYIAVVSKVILLYTCYLLPAGQGNQLLELLFLLSMLYLPYILWSSGLGIKLFLAISSISSGAVLLVVEMNSGYLNGFILYLCYFITSLVSFLILFLAEKGQLNSESGLILFFVSLTIPCSLLFLYKFISVLCLLGESWYLLLFWVSYSIVEQIYLYIFLLEKICKSFNW